MPIIGFQAPILLQGWETLSTSMWVSKSAESLGHCFYRYHIIITNNNYDALSTLCVSHAGTLSRHQSISFSQWSWPCEIGLRICFFYRWMSLAVFPKWATGTDRVRAKRGDLTWGLSALATTDVWGQTTSCCKGWHVRCRTVRASVTLPWYFASSIHLPGVTIRTPSRHCPVSPRRQNRPQLRNCCVWSLSRARLFATPWTAARQASLSITNSRSSLKLMYIESVMPSNHLIFETLTKAIKPVGGE